jgi:hypothetical protein
MKKTVLRMIAVASAACVAALGMGDPAGANCEQTGKMHGGKPFLQRLTGEWRLAGTIASRSVDGAARAAWEGDELVLRFPALAATGTGGIRTVRIRYEARCDEFRAARDGDAHAGLAGSGISRGNALDITFAPHDGGQRTDMSFESERGDGWRVLLSRELRPGRWENYGTFTLRR